MLIITTIILPALSIPLTEAAVETQTPWTTLMDMPTARGGLGVVALGGKIYAIGGSNGGAPLNINERYDTVYKQWELAAPLPTARSEFAIAVYHNKIYVFGGTIGNGFVGNTEVYDPTKNAWETKSSMPTPRDDLSACVVNDKIYLVGGKKYSSNAPYYTETDIMEIYDPATNTWSIGPPIPNPVYNYASAVLDGKIYIIGGSQNSGSANAIVTGINQVYNPNSNTWTLASTPSSSVANGAAVATQDYLAPAKIYFMGGSWKDTYSSKNLVYNANNDSWTNATDMSVAKSLMGITVLDDIIYVVGGYDGTNWLSTLEQYTPIGYGTAPPQIVITSPENGTHVRANLAFTVNREAKWMGYSLDNQANISIGGPVPLENLSQGAHSIVVYANDSLGNMGASKPAYFSIDSSAPYIAIVNPQNQTYGSTDIQLVFQINEETKNLSYSLDGSANVTIIGNVTLPALSNGQHTLTLYAVDKVGNADAQTVNFEVAPFPMITFTAVIVVVIIILAAGYLFIKRKKTEKQLSVSPEKSPSQ